jgi:4-alpha-glucanotransferase
MTFDRRSGVLLHPTSLPGPHGLGDLGDAALRWLDWLQSAGQGLWQVLPLGPTGYGDSPYQSFSSFAGNPYLISLVRLEREGWLRGGDLSEDPFGAGRVDFGPVIEFRLAALHRAAERWYADADPEARAAFADFRARAGWWLDDFALFMALKEAHGGRAWVDWAPALRGRDPEALAAARRDHARVIERHMLWQWWFDAQWSSVRAAAAERGIRILGDVPIFVAFDAADTWANQELFDLGPDGEPSVVAGVPPDYFSATGQRWGNPLYLWDRHAERGFDWWIARVRRTLELVDLLRIDHFRGFEAYWEIPANEPTAERGRWRPGPGGAFLDALQGALATDSGAQLPIVAEDLGVITPAVEALRDAHALPGMKVLQFAFAGGSQDPYLPHNYPRNAVVYTGTHDNDTSASWFAQAPEAERQHLCRYLNVDGAHPAWSLWRLAQASVADTAVAPLQDLLGLGSEGRMNTPGAANGNWGWRFGWDDLPADLAERMAELATLYGRSPGSLAVDTAYRQSVIDEA